MYPVSDGHRRSRTSDTVQGSHPRHTYMARKPEIWDETYDQDVVVLRRQSARLVGTVFGNVEVERAGTLHHEGLIWGNLHVQAGGRVYDHGMVFGEITADVASDVTLHG